VCARIHIERAADTSGYTAGEFQAGERLLVCEIGNFDDRPATACSDDPSLFLKVIEFEQIEDDAPDAAVADDDVGAVSEVCDRYVVLGTVAEHPAGILDIMDRDIVVGGSASLCIGVDFYWFVYFDIRIQKECLQVFFGLRSIHRSNSFRVGLHMYIIIEVARFWKWDGRLSTLYTNLMCAIFCVATDSQCNTTILEQGCDTFCIIL